MYRTLQINHKLRNLILLFTLIPDVKPEFGIFRFDRTKLLKL